MNELHRLSARHDVIVVSRASKEPADRRRHQEASTIVVHHSSARTHTLVHVVRIHTHDLCLESMLLRGVAVPNCTYYVATAEQCRLDVDFFLPANSGEKQLLFYFRLVLSSPAGGTPCQHTHNAL